MKTTNFRTAALEANLDAKLSALRAKKRLEKSEADLANEALDAAMTDSDRAYWAAAGENEKRVEGKGRGR